ncbi:MAG: hypothetical protein KKD99_13255 [Proteobacteria bacterium]|nr:hypothetical protein [Pseudomonadota bacterium]MBU4449547.1 hypothetical protein [Pseudomonadota bacterium]
MRNHSDYPGETGEWEFGYGSEVFNPEMADQEYLSEIRRSRVPLHPQTGFRGRPPVPGLNQMNNVFFIQRIVANLPPDTVRVMPAG